MIVLRGYTSTVHMQKTTSSLSAFLVSDDKTVEMELRTGEKINPEFYTSTNPIALSMVRFFTGTNGEAAAYTNLVPSTAGVGGISAGTVINSIPFSKLLDNMFYPFILAMQVNPSVAEKGSTQTVTITLNYDSLATYRLNGNAISSGAVVETGITSDKSWQCVGTKDGVTKTADGSISFLNRVYWGTTSGILPQNLEILNSSNQLTGDKNKTISYDCSTGAKYWLAYPSRLGVFNNIKVNGLSNYSFNISYFPFTNSYGFTEEYIIYVSNNLVYGAAINVQWG